MKKIKDVLLTAVAGFLLGVSVFGQMISQEDTEARQRKMNEWESDRRQKTEVVLRRMSQGNRGGFSLSEKERREILRNIETRALSEQRARLLPDSKYIKENLKLLTDEKTGIVRLFPEMNCHEGKIVSVSEIERCADVIPIRGGGSLYSFRNRVHWTDRKYFSDIHFVGGRLVVSDMEVFGVIAKIGDYKLEELTVDSAPVKFLAGYGMKRKVSELKAEAERFKKGVTDKGVVYSHAVDAAPGATYLLRSAALMPFDPVDIRLLDLNEWSDIIVAFKVIAKEQDGSLVLLWKELKKAGSPQMRR